MALVLNIVVIDSEFLISAPLLDFLFYALTIMMIVSPTPRPESVRKKNVFISIVWLGSRCCFYYNFEQGGF